MCMWRESEEVCAACSLSLSLSFSLLDLDFLVGLGVKLEGEVQRRSSSQFRSDYLMPVVLNGWPVLKPQGGALSVLAQRKKPRSRGRGFASSPTASLGKG